MRFLAVAAVAIVFFRYLIGGGRTFSVAKGERAAPQIELFPVSSFLLFYAASTAPLNLWGVVAGVAGLGSGLILFEWARATIRGRFFSFAYSNDQPGFLLVTGPYRYIRNPFYTSYLIGYASSAIMLPGFLTLVIFAVMCWMLMAAARQEERKFRSSPLAGVYADYARRTGRFLPGIGKLKPVVTD